MLQPIWLWDRWLRRHPLPHLPLRPRLRLLHQVVLVAVHPEQVEQRLEAPPVEVLEALVVPLAEVPEEPLELGVLQVQGVLLVLELLQRVPLERSLEQSLP